VQAGLLQRQIKCLTNYFDMSLVNQIIEDNLHLFTNPNKRVWSADEMRIAYQIKNLTDGTNVIDTGCNSCRRSTVTRTRKIVEGYLKTRDESENPT
jgi:hypothetical protein